MFFGIRCIACIQFPYPPESCCSFGIPRNVSCAMQIYNRKKKRSHGNKGCVCVSQVNATRQPGGLSFPFIFTSQNVAYQPCKATQVVLSGWNGDTEHGNDTPQSCLRYNVDPVGLDYQSLHPSGSVPFLGGLFGFLVVVSAVKRRKRKRVLREKPNHNCSSLRRVL